MAKKPRSSYFTPVELELLMNSYAEKEHIFQKKSNTVAAAKERELAWRRIADQVNEHNLTGSRRTWQQIKMKYKNIVQTANRKKAEARRTGVSVPPLREELLLSQNSVTDDVISLIEPSPITDRQAVEEDGDTLPAATEREDTQRPVQSNTGSYSDEEGPSTSIAQLTSLPVKQLYKVYLQKQIEKSDLEMDHIRLQIKKAQMEMQLLDHQLQEIKKTS